MSSQQPPDQPEREINLTPEQVERLSPDALAALSTASFGRASSGRRGCRVMMIIFGVGAFVGIVISSLLLRSFTNSAGVAIADRRALNSLNEAFEKAQAVAQTTGSLLGADAVGLSSTEYSVVEATQPSTGPQVVSVRHEQAMFVAAALGREGSCWFVRISLDVALAPQPWNHIADAQTCASAFAPVDGWMNEPFPTASPTVPPAP